METVIHPPRDPNTLSNYNNWVSTHITANFDILFEQKRLVGNVVHKLKSITNAESTDIVLDTNHVDIGDVKVNGQPSHWEILPPLEPYGAALKIKLNQGVKLNETVEVDVCYQSTSLWASPSMPI
jgi:leukotriene-A4 hydrolase